MGVAAVSEIMHTAVFDNPDCSGDPVLGRLPQVGFSNVAMGVITSTVAEANPGQRALLRVRLLDMHRRRLTR